ncbi:hypothetical protein [Curtobacterium sp. PhB191]|uniref:hypothetical protein n=1 Tax=Curtobacterium sp. PhB191 TaxID=2485202 RepID=UPI0010502DCE|nr:hypothetical protein [Curtobacterium sp. PhB191]
MDSWMIEAQLPDHPSSLIVISAYGVVDHVAPSDSPLQIARDIDGFNDAGVEAIPFDRPAVLIHEATEGGRDVTGMTLQFRASASTPIRSAAVVISITYVPDSLVPTEPENVEAALAQSRIDSIEQYQKSTDGHHEGDDAPVTLTFRQVQKLAAIIDAARQGQTAYADQLDKVTWFLNVAALEANPRIDAQNSRSAEELWAEIDSSVPWPLHGPPRAQPDIDS